MRQRMLGELAVTMWAITSSKRSGNSEQLGCSGESCASERAQVL